MPCTDLFLDHPFWGILFAVALLASACSRLEGGPPQKRRKKNRPGDRVGDRFEIFLSIACLWQVCPQIRYACHRPRHARAQARGTSHIFLRHGAEAPTEHVAPAPARDGIYLPELTFPQAGEWLVSLHIPEGATSVVSLPPLTVFASHAEAKIAPEPAASDGISFLKEQQWKILTQTAPVSRRPLIERLRLAGVVAVHPGNTAVVTPPIAGHLLPPPGPPCRPLGHVKAGQVLAMVQPHLSGTDLLTLISTQQQILALEMELTVKAAGAESEAIRHGRPSPKPSKPCGARGAARAKREIGAGAGGSRVRPAQGRGRLERRGGLRKTYDQAKKQLAERPRPVSQGVGIPAVELKAPLRGSS